MNNEFSFEITNESKNAINEILKQQGLRHFKLYTDFYGELDVINYEEYQKLEKEKDKEIERLTNIINEQKENIRKALGKMCSEMVLIDGRGYYYTDISALEDILELKEGK